MEANSVILHMGKSEGQKMIIKIVCGHRFYACGQNRDRKENAGIMSGEQGKGRRLLLK